MVASSIRYLPHCPLTLLELCIVHLEGRSFLFGFRTLTAEPRGRLGGAPGVLPEGFRSGTELRAWECWLVVCGNYEN